MYATAWFKQYDDHFHFSSFSARAWMSHGCVVVAHLERCVSTRIWSKLNNIYRLPFFLSAMCNRTKYFAHVCFIGSSIEAVDLIFLSIFPDSRPNSPVTFFMPDAGFWDCSIVFFFTKAFFGHYFFVDLIFLRYGRFCKCFIWLPANIPFHHSDRRVFVVFLGVCMCLSVLKQQLDFVLKLRVALCC